MARFKRGASLTGYGLIVGLISIVALTALTRTGDNVNQLFGTTSDALSLIAPEDPVDLTPDALGLTDLSGVQTATQFESDIVQLAGFDEPVAVSISGDGSPEYRVCSDAACSSELQTWGGGGGTVSSGQYLQLRAESSASPVADHTITLTVGGVANNWVLSTQTELFAFTSHTFTNCGQTGVNGPSLGTCRGSYSTSWDENSSFFNMSTTGFQRFTVPATGDYRITARGAQGGGEGTGNTRAVNGELGAEMIGTFALTEGEILVIIVGQQGNGTSTDPHGNENGGGGGSFVLFTDDTPLIIAGGGGGGHSNIYGNSCSTIRTADYGEGRIEETSLGRSCGNGSVSNRSGGQGGLASGSNCGGAGAGLNGNGASGGGHCSSSAGGTAITSGGEGASHTGCYSANAFGGFGGGGSGGLGGPGGGGGYAGGSVACQWSSYSTFGGGGSSFNDGTDPDNTAGSNSGHGSVVIERI